MAGTSLPPMRVSDELKAHLARTIVDHETLLAALGSPPTTTALRLTNGTARERVEALFGDAIVPSARTVEDVVVLEHSAVGPPPALRTATAAGGVAVVGAGCYSSVLRGAPVYAGGVVSVSRSLAVDDPLHVYCDVEKQVLRGTLVEDVSDVQLRKMVFVGEAKALMTRTQLFVEDHAGNGVSPRGIAFIMCRPVVPVLRIPPLLTPDGLEQHVGIEERLGVDAVFLQNLPSVLVGHALGPRPGERVLDMCAAPGGKTTHLALLMRNEGCVVACERKLKRVVLVQALLQRFALTCVQTVHTDVLRLTVNPHALFDRVLCDAPCSGSGNRPQFMLNEVTTVAHLRSIAEYQQRLLAAAAAQCRRGGRIVYSTCSVFVDENEAVVSWALAHLRDQVRLVDCAISAGGPGLACSPLDAAACTLVRRFDPRAASGQQGAGAGVGTTGFFMAAFERL